MSTVSRENSMKRIRPEPILALVAACFLPASFCLSGLQTSAEGGEVRRVTGGEMAFRVNLNTATVEELAELPEIGEAIAERIVACREACGGFSSVEALIGVGGIGAQRVEKLRDYITLEDTDENTGSR